MVWSALHAHALYTQKEIFINAKPHSYPCILIVESTLFSLSSLSISETAPTVKHCFIKNTPWKSQGGRSTAWNTLCQCHCLHKNWNLRGGKIHRGFKMHVFECRSAEGCPCACDRICVCAQVCAHGCVCVCHLKQRVHLSRTKVLQNVRD